MESIYNIHVNNVFIAILQSDLKYRAKIYEHLQWNDTVIDSDNCLCM